MKRAALFEWFSYQPAGFWSRAYFCLLKINYKIVLYIINQ